MPPFPNAPLTSRDDIRRILVIKWSAMGDVVIATTAIEDLHRAFPGREIHLNTMAPWDRLFAGDPRLSRVFCVDLRGREKGLRGTLKWLREVRAGRYDLIVDLQCTDRSRALLALLWLSGSGGIHRLGNRRRFPYTIAPAPMVPPVHDVDLARGTLRAAGIPTPTPRPVLHPSPRHRANAAALLALHGLEPGAYAVFLPGCQAAGHLKRWGAERYAALARSLAEDGLTTVLLGAKDEADECRKIETGAGAGVVNLCGKTELLDVVPICEGARLIVANDTGTAHIASATGRPMVVICGPTDPKRVKPVGDNVIALQADLPCINCYCKHPCDHHSCMVAITPAMVQERLVQLVPGRPPGSVPP